MFNLQLTLRLKMAQLRFVKETLLHSPTTLKMYQRGLVIIGRFREEHLQALQGRAHIQWYIIRR